jgi:uncharacterized protein (TIGR01319 family)
VTSAAVTTRILDARAVGAAPVACLDVGSTFTKLAAVEPGTGRLLATALHPTTVGGDVLHGVDACQEAVTAGLGGAPGEVLACSSAGGGLRLVVVGQELLVSAEAGRRVALAAGARVAHTSAGRLDQPGLDAVLDARPDVVLLVGGTDGGDDRVLLHNARALAEAAGRGALRVPVVVAGNVDARDEVCALLRAGGAAVHPTANVLPDIGEIDPAPARAVIREVFLRHVIGGKGLSRDDRFTSMVRAVTPDAVLDGVRVLADVLRDADPQAGDLLVVDVGGATTDVYSAVAAADGDTGPTGGVVGDPAQRRTVEGDLGVRWSAPWVVDAALAQDLLTEPDAVPLRDAAARRAEDAGYLPDSPAEAAVDLRLAALAATVAVRRHLAAVADGVRGISRVVCSGGVFRHADAAGLDAVLAGLRRDAYLRGPLARAAVTVDRHYVLAAAGLLARTDPPTAAALAARHLA